MIVIGASAWMFHLVPAHPGCPGQSLESRKMVVVIAEDTEAYKVG